MTFYTFIQTYQKLVKEGPGCDTHIFLSKADRYELPLKSQNQS